MSVRVGIGWGAFADPDLSPVRLLEVAEQIEELGYDSVWLSDSATYAGPAPLAALAAVAARTTRLKLGTNVLVAPARNPILLAKELATVDALSAGRLFPAFGLGIDTAPEAVAIGVPRAERAARTAEAMEIVRLLWAGGPASFDGRFSSFNGVTLSPVPTRPTIEIWLGGSSPAALRRTGRLADGWLGSFVSPAELGACVEAIVTAATAAGRHIDEDHYGTTVFAAPALNELPSAARSLLNMRSELHFDDHVAIGAAALRALLHRFRQAGASKFVVIPIARQIGAWLEEMRSEVIEPFELAA